MGISKSQESVLKNSQAVSSSMSQSDGDNDHTITAVDLDKTFVEMSFDINNAADHIMHNPKAELTSATNLRVTHPTGFGTLEYYCRIVELK